jgi:hypothetical protein
MSWRNLKKRQIAALETAEYYRLRMLAEKKPQQDYSARIAAQRSKAKAMMKDALGLLK